MITLSYLTDKIVYLYKRTTQRTRRLVASAIILLLSFLLIDYLFPFPPSVSYSQTVLDSKGKMLHAFLTNDDKWRMKTELEEITPDMYRAVLFKEDKWFYWHFGINPLAVIRALGNNIVRGKRTSGASTITMQVARLLAPKQRSYGNKLIEMFRAIQLEWHLSKAEILQLYLNLIPYGGNIEGIKSASVLFFDKMPDHLSLAEITTLTIIPNRPTTLHLGKNNDDIRKVRNEWLTRFSKAKLFTEADIADALDEPLSASRRDSPKWAPHFSYRMKHKHPQIANIHTDLVFEEQQKIEQLTNNYVKRLYAQHIKNAAVLVINNHTQAIEAYIGSADFNNHEDGGQCDGVRALRSPGSTLKPFLMALAFDAGIVTPKLKITDVPINIMGYAPDNYDNKFNGYLTMSDALGLSLNIPFVKTLHQYGVNKFRQKLAAAHFSLFRDEQRKFGLSLILGGCSVTLEEITRLYSQFAITQTTPIPPSNTSTSWFGSGVGDWFSSTTTSCDTCWEAYNQIENNDDLVSNDNDSTDMAGYSGTFGSSKPLFSPEAAYMVTEILSQLMRPDLPKNIDNVRNLPRIAWKTGTSYGRRDAWSIGYNANYTVGIWVGNFSGQGVPDLNGTQTATPLLFDVFNTLDSSPASDWFAPPQNMTYRWICSETGLIPDAYCTNQVMDYYVPGISPSRKCNHLTEVIVNQTATFSYCTTCMPTTGFKRQQYPAYPPELVAYYDREHVPYQHVPPHNPQCTRLFGGDKPVIVSPVHNLSYLIDRADNQQIMLLCNVSNDVEKVYWYVNGDYFGESKPNERLFFNPPSGSNVITCLDDKGRKSEAIIIVSFL